MRTNEHHFYWEAREFKKFRLSNLIRCNELSKQEMVIDIHNDLHANIRPTVAPSASIARNVLARLENMPRSYRALDAAKALRDDLEGTDASYLSEHLGRQIPFLELSARALRQRRL